MKGGTRILYKKLCSDHEFRDSQCSDSHTVIEEEEEEEEEEEGVSLLLPRLLFQFKCTSV
jgi:hypothetical protein